MGCNEEQIIMEKSTDINKILLVKSRDATIHFAFESVQT